MALPFAPSENRLPFCCNRFPCFRCARDIHCCNIALPPVQVLSLRRAGHPPSAIINIPTRSETPAASASPRARWKSCKNLLFYPTKRMGENEKEKLARRGESSEKDFRRPRLSLRIQILESAMGCGVCTMNRPIINTKTMAKKGRRKKCDVSISAFETLRHRIYSHAHATLFSELFPFLFMASGGSESLKQHQQCMAAALSLNCDFTVLIRVPIKAAAYALFSHFLFSALFNSHEGG